MESLSKINHPNIEKRNRAFSRLLMNEKFITQEMLSECLCEMNSDSDFVADVLIHKSYLSAEMVAGIYLKAGVLHCPYCHHEEKAEAVVLKVECNHCNKIYMFPTRYPFFKRKNSTTTSMQKLTGTDLSHYRIQYCLGSGGMGEVYRAIQKGLNRVVAIKILAPHLANNPKLVQRFQREARVAARLNHPNLVQIHDVGTFEGYHYMAMEYIDGLPLQKKIPKENGLPLNTAAHYLKESLKGLKRLHDKDIIHRDIKPDNIMVNSLGQIKLADFGLAKSEEGNDYLTQCGAIVGTPYYMSPEQCVGKPATKLSDIYSLGMTFYYMLRGSIPYDGETALEIITQHIDNPSPSLKENLPVKWNKIYQKMVAESSEKRYQSVDELQEDVEQLGEKDFVIEKPNNIKLYITAAVIVLLLLLAGRAKKKLRLKDRDEKHTTTTKEILKNTNTKKPPKNSHKKISKVKDSKNKIKNKKKPFVRIEFNTIIQKIENKKLSFKEAILLLTNIQKNKKLKPRLKKDVIDYILQLQKKERNRLQQASKRKQMAESYLESITEKRWQLLIVENVESEQFTPSIEVQIYINQNAKEHWHTLKESIQKIKQIKLHEQNDIITAREMAKKLSLQENSVLLDEYIERLDSEIDLREIWENHFTKLHKLTSKKRYDEAYDFMKNFKEEFQRLKSARSYEHCYEMYYLQKKIVGKVLDFWNIFNGNVHDFMEVGQHIHPKKVAAQVIVNGILKNRKKYRYKIDRVQIGFFYLFSREFTLAQKQLQKELQNNKSLLQLYSKHLHYLKGKK